MKTFLIGSTLCVAFAVFPALGQAQPATTDDLYKRCDAEIRARHDAHDTCRQYLEQAPFNDPHIENVKKWMLKYYKVLPYVQFLQGLTPDPKATWFVYEPDLAIDLPQTSEKKDKFPIHLARSFDNPNEEAMLKKAEAVYSGPSTMVDDIFRDLNFWADTLPEDKAPVWGRHGNDNIQLPSVVTAKAVRYYYDLSMAERENPHLPTGFTALGSSMKYDATIKHLDQYSHAKDTFENVYVADMTLEWSFTCGGLCGMGFTRNKLVVLDRDGKVLAMYLDAPVNSSMWVS